MQHSCSIPAAVLQQSCSSPAALLQHSCSIPAAFLQQSCSIPAAFLQHSCSSPAAVLQHSCSVPVFSIKMSCEIVFLHNLYQIFVFSIVLQTTPHHTPSIASTSRPSHTILCCDQLHGHDLKNVETFVLAVSMCRLLLVFSNQLRPKSPTPSRKKPNTHRTPSHAIQRK